MSEAPQQTMAAIRTRDLGLISYEDAYTIQRACMDEIHTKGPVLLLCEHPAILTLGRLADESHILASREELMRRGVDVRAIDRGGEVTLHCPGQLVVYPIVDLTRYGKDLHLYLSKLEQLAIDLLGHFGILASRIEGKTGAWVGAEKIVSIGIGVRRWISYHGLAINVHPDLDLYSLIRPCGMDIRMTSMDNCLDKPIEMNLVKAQICPYFLNTFESPDFKG